ncbi:MAG: antitoxin Xre/MbcA/ParS toxin-binding domain-containing protein [Gemmatimonadaceae bacterium]
MSNRRHGPRHYHCLKNPLAASRPIMSESTVVERANSQESERRARLERATAFATETLGSADKAHGWLTTANRALGGISPLVLLDTDAGALVVEQVLGRIAHGIFD